MAALRNLPVVAVGAAPAVALAVSVDPGSIVTTLLVVAAGLLLGLLGAAAALLAFLGAKLVWAVPRNGFGLCSGWSRAFEDEEAGRAPLTPWLYRLLNEYANLQDEEPLTFGHLWAGPEGDRDQPPQKREKRFLEPAMMTTNLTSRRAHRLPLESDEWLFSPEEMRKLFPEEVVAWMEEKASPSGEVVVRDGGRERRLRWFPVPGDVPVIVPTRLSLSFPVLLSAVPLWRCEGGPAALELSESGPGSRPRRCWFSDGGISSNFPIHFFDAMVPRWPTFGINLRPFAGKDLPSDDQRRNTWMVSSEREEIPDWWYPTKGLKDLFTGIANTMQNRVDEAQMRVPGYRDRIAHVSLSEAEGGMNLSMEPETIENLVDRGRYAAERLRIAYTGDPAEDGVTWDSHRWTRLRSSLAVLEEMHDRFAFGYSDEDYLSGARPYSALVARGDGDPPGDYRWAGVVQRDHAEGAIEAIEGLAADENGPTVVAGAPEPAPEGRIEPRA